MRSDSGGCADMQVSPTGEELSRLEIGGQSQLFPAVACFRQTTRSAGQQPPDAAGQHVERAAAADRSSQNTKDRTGGFHLGRIAKKQHRQDKQYYYGAKPAAKPEDMLGEAMLTL